MKKLIFLILIGFAINVEAEQKIAYVDMQQAIQSTSAGKKAKKKLESEFKEKEKRLKTKREDLQKMQTDLEKKAMVLSEKVREQKTMEFQKSAYEYQKLMVESQQAIQKREIELTKPILEKLKKVIAKVAKKEGYSIILEKGQNNVLWGKKDLNLTKKVIKAFEKQK